MEYDVFISYSRKDTAIADRICAAFDRVGITYFIDRQGIGGGLEFPEILAEAIVGCRKVLFLASANSYASKFTNSEITFAFNKKEKNSIIPYCIDDCQMPVGLQFVFSGINWRTLREHPIEPVLVDDVLGMLGRQRKAVAAPAAAKVYAAGDYYNENGREGIVFEADETGRHGKIMSLSDLPEAAWATVGDRTEATDREEGMKNLLAIRLIEGWREKFPAFAACAALGEGWYLPAYEEMKALDADWEFLSDAAQRHGGEALAVLARYWTSSELDTPFPPSAPFALDFRFSPNRSGLPDSVKRHKHRVRPVAAF